VLGGGLGGLGGGVGLRGFEGMERGIWGCLFFAYG
jgi:hypothetical protein